MRDDAPEVEPDTGVAAVPIGGRRVRLLTLGQLDRRTTAYRKAVELIAAIENDLGGADTLTAAARQLVQRASLLGAWAEDLEARWLAGEPVDPAMLCTVANAQRRVFEALGLHHQAGGSNRPSRFGAPTRQVTEAAASAA